MLPMHPSRNLAFCAATSSAIAMLLACDPDTSNTRPDSASSERDATARTSQWQHGTQGQIIAVQRELQLDLEAAVEQARRAAPEARERWQATDQEQRRHWAIKWAAETTNGSVEYVWVQPQHWSAFRIEGTLLNQPLQPLASGRSAIGESVSFPIDELADWLYESRDETTGQVVRLGGYTVKFLSDVFGPPPTR